MSTVTVLPFPPVAVPEAAGVLLEAPVDPPESTITSVDPTAITVATRSKGRILARSVNNLLIHEYYGARVDLAHGPGLTEAPPKW